MDLNSQSSRPEDKGNPASPEAVGIVANCRCFGSEAPEAPEALPPAATLAGMSSFMWVSGWAQLVPRSVKGLYQADCLS